MMNEFGKFGTLQESNGRYALRFERFFSHKSEDVFRVITNPSYFSQWYPFATGEMDLRIGGEIDFDDGEGTTYNGTSTELEPPTLFSFREVDDGVSISLRKEGQGCLMIFTHTFSDDSWAVNTAAGLHRCLDESAQIVNGIPIEWHENSRELRKIYSDAFNMKG